MARLLVVRMLNLSGVRFAECVSSAFACRSISFGSSIRERMICPRSRVQDGHLEVHYWYLCASTG
jgi:hypothetical protein